MSITIEELDEKCRKFDKLEERGSFYPMALNLIDKGFEVEAYLLILATWNFAGFRYILRDFDINSFKETIKETNHLFGKLKNEVFKTADFDRLEDDIKILYTKLRETVKQTGASKLMHFKNPALFVMWDTKIRNRYKINNRGTGDDYIKFLKEMKKLFGDIQWNNKNKTLAKAIDEYNYVSITLVSNK